MASGIGRFVSVDASINTYTVSTVTMIRLGKKYGNLMVDVVAANEKLVERVHRIVAAATGASEAQIESALDDAGGDARVAIVAILAGVEVEEAKRRLEGSDRSIASALKGPS